MNLRQNSWRCCCCCCCCGRCWGWHRMQVCSFKWKWMWFMKCRSTCLKMTESQSEIVYKIMYVMEYNWPWHKLSNAHQTEHNKSLASRVTHKRCIHAIKYQLWPTRLLSLRPECNYRHCQHIRTTTQTVAIIKYLFLLLLLLLRFHFGFLFQCISVCSCALRLTHDSVAIRWKPTRKLTLTKRPRSKNTRWKLLKWTFGWFINSCCCFFPHSCRSAEFSVPGKWH